MVFSPPPSNEELLRRLEVIQEHGKGMKSARLLDMTTGGINHTLRLAAERGLLGPEETKPGFVIRSISTPHADGSWVRQVKEPGEKFEPPASHLIKGVSALVDAEGRTVQQWIKTREDDVAREAAIKAAIEALKSKIPRELPVAYRRHPTNDDLLNQFTVTDLHLGCLAWSEETGGDDYDLKIAEQLLVDWFAAAIYMSPPAKTAVFAQLGDLLHHDSHLSITPTHAHVLDADSRFQKIVRVVIRTLRRVIAMLLDKHEHVHLVMCDANHDPAAGCWLREMFAAFFENEPRITVDSSAGTYYAYEHGLTGLFYHHGHRRKINDVDSVFAGRFREMFGRTKYAYAHVGHLHSDELKSTNLMKVERHETLAAPDAYAANGGWISGRSAKVITYSRLHGEVGRITLTPEMVQGAAA